MASVMAMKQSTCAVLPARERVVGDAELDAPRGDERRLRRRRRRSTSAVAAMATACGSCAWIDVGPSCLRTRDSRQAAARSISLRGASGIRSRPSRHAPEQLALAGAPPAPRAAPRCAGRARCTSPGSGRRASCARCRCAGRTSDAESAVSVEPRGWALRRCAAAPTAWRTSGTPSSAFTTDSSQPDRAVEEAAAQDVVAEERGRRLHDQIERPTRGGRARTSAARRASCSG